MKTRLLTIMFVLVWILAACAPAPATPAPQETSAPVVEPTSPPAVEPTTPPTDEPTTVPEPTTTEPPAEPIKIGFYGPLTGPVAKAGRALMNGALQKFEEVNAAGGLLGRPIEFVSCDDKSKPEEAVTCVQRLITQDKVVANVGSLHSPHLMATGPILDENKVPTVAAGTSPTWCQEGFQYLWRATANADAHVATMAKSLEESGLKKMAILYQNDDYGIGGRDALAEGLPFMEVVDEEAYNLGDKDWSGQIIKMIAANPEIVAVWSLGEDLGPILNQLRAQGWTGPIIGPEGATFPAIADIAGENAANMIFAQLYYVPPKPEDYPDPAIADFLTKYLANYNEMPEDDNAYRGYDAATVLVTAIQNADSLDPEAIKDAINSITDMKGLAGAFNYAQGGCEGISESRLWEWKDGKIVPFDGFNN